MKRICLIFEFPPEADFQLHSVMETLQGNYPKDKVYCFHGFLKKYRPGGFQILRMLNLFWIYGLLPFHLLLRRPRWILVRSAPPGIQVWCSMWATLFKIPTIAWIMDYHPEIEIRALEEKALFRPCAKILKLIDRKALNQLQGAMVLDEAMFTTVRQQAPNLEIQIHPTWEQYPVMVDLPHNTSSETNIHELRFVYAGNLSSNHPLETFEKLLKSLNQQYPHTRIDLHVIGTSTKGEKRFRQLAKSCNIQLHILPRIPFNELKERLIQLNPHYGVVLMNEKTAGLFSPSKFAGYLSARIPILYCGPPKTNADKICQDFQGGLSLTTQTPASTIAKLALNMAKPATIKAYKEALNQAYEYFAEHNAQSFVSKIASMIHFTSNETAF